MTGSNNHESVRFMKRLYYIVALALLTCACSVDEPIETLKTHGLYPTDVSARIEEDALTPDTRAYVDTALKVLWESDDRISLFNKYTFNKEYRFTGETGANAGIFKEVETGEVVTGNELDNVYAVYPYWETTTISNSGVITLNLPSVQTYKENSFGRGANTMVSATSNTDLLFKNLCGYLILKLYGDDVFVSSITLQGNKGEPLSGAADVMMDVGSTPSLTFREVGSSTTLTLNCGTPVQLGTSGEEATVFWLVVPPTTFDQGFTITVISSSGGTFSKSTSKSATITRNATYRMGAIEVIPEHHQANNVIIYTSSDGEIVEPRATDVFGANIVSNKYMDGLGVLSFDGDVTSIGDMAFWGCHSLTGVAIPNSVTSIGHEAFEFCYSLTSVAIPNSVTSIGHEAFEFCYSLTRVTIPEGLTSIEFQVFGSCSSLTSVTIPDSVTSIGNEAFWSCTSLTSVTIPESVTRIGFSAFAGCTSLTSVTIPESVTSIGTESFVGCFSLKSFKGKYASPDGVFLIDSGAIIAVAYAAIDGSVTIPDGVTSIKRYAFSGCSSLTSITIPGSVTSIGNGAFQGCTGLTSFTIPDGVTSVGEQAFSNCTNLTNVTIPESVTSIGTNPFSGCFSMESFKGKYASPDGVFLIDSGVIIAMAYAAINGSVTIPDGVTSIGDGTFVNCTSLTSVVIPDSVMNIGQNAFYGCTGLTSVIIPDSVTSIGDQAFIRCTNLTSIVIPNSVTSIGRNAFSDCSSLTSVTIPDGVTSIEYGTFNKCTSLTSVTIPDGVTSIGYATFAYCTSLTSVTIPSSVKSIGDWAFYSCTGFTSITVLPEMPPTGGNRMFDNTKNSPIYVPAGSVDAYKSAQYWSNYANRIYPLAPLPEGSPF